VITFEEGLDRPIGLLGDSAVEPMVPALDAQNLPRRSGRADGISVLGPISDGQYVFITLQSGLAIFFVRKA
jgi:hypothetical protein